LAKEGGKKWDRNNRMVHVLHVPDGLNMTIKRNPLARTEMKAIDSFENTDHRLTFDSHNCPIECTYNMWGKAFAKDEFPGTVKIATDGSTHTGCNSTAAMVYVTDEFEEANGTLEAAQFYNWKLDTANNLHAELSALVLAVLSAPVTVDLRLITDCLVGKLMHESGLSSPPSPAQLMRMAGRPYLTLLRHATQLKAKLGATTTIDWVASHTGAGDIDSLANEAADARAKQANEDESVKEPGPAWSKFLMGGELEFVLYINDEPVHDDTRRTIRTAARQKICHDWVDTGRSTSTVFAENRERFSQHRKPVMRGLSADAEAFVMMATATPPCRVVKYKQATQSSDEKACRECPFFTEDTAAHYISCPEMEKGAQRHIDSIEEVLTAAMEDANDKKKTSVKGHVRVNMTDKEYWVLGCTPKTVPVCDSSLQRSQSTSKTGGATLYNRPRRGLGPAPLSPGRGGGIGPASHPQREPHLASVAGSG
jgi:hypothetical protein